MCVFAWSITQAAIWISAVSYPSLIQVCVSISMCVFAGTSIPLWVCIKIKYSVRDTLPACLDALVQMFVKQTSARAPPPSQCVFVCVKH